MLCIIKYILCHNGYFSTCSGKRARKNGYSSKVLQIASYKQACVHAYSICTRLPLETPYKREHARAYTNANNYTHIMHLLSISE